MEKPKFTAMDELLASDKESTPMDVLAAAYADAPPPIKEALNHAAMETLMVTLPQLKLVVERGAIIAKTDLRTVTDLFTESLDYAAKHRPALLKSLSATARDVGIRLAEDIDAGIGRLILEDTDINHAAYLDVTAAHAKLVRSLSDIPLTEEQLAAYAKAREEADGNAA